MLRRVTGQSTTSTNNRVDRVRPEPCADQIFVELTECDHMLGGRSPQRYANRRAGPRCEGAHATVFGRRENLRSRITNARAEGTALTRGYRSHRISSC